MARIWVVMKDPGGTNAVWPVVEELRRRNHIVLPIAHGKAIEVLAQKKVSFFAAQDDVNILQELFNCFPDVYITSICSARGIGRDLIPLLRSIGIPTVAVQDCWGGAALTEFKDTSYWPDVLCVQDELAKTMMSDAWVDYEKQGGKIEITGQPAFDKLATLDSYAAKQKIWDTVIQAPKYTIPKFIVYAGQLEHTAETLRALIQTLNQIPYDICLVALQHRRYARDYVSQEELDQWEEVLREFKNGMLFTNHKDISTEEWVATGDVVVSMTSTVLAIGAYLRKECVAYLPPNIFESELATGGYKFLPMEKLGACSIAQSQEDLTDLVTRALSERHDPLGLRINQEKYFITDGKSASRVVNVIENLLGEGKRMNRQNAALNEFLTWQKQTCKSTPVQEKTCSCISTLREPSWASAVHNILFHVCDEHAKKFGVPSGPYWEQDLR